ncbi:MAG: serine hydrolase, partial [Sphingomonas sp.]|nr:serine hydrolase [Sphingomonas sp.]
MIALLLAVTPPLPAAAGIAFRAGQTERPFTQGLADRTTRRPVRITDPVRMASISKLAVALVALRLVERRTLELDRDVADYLEWPLRNPAFPDAPVTLRQLLSHTSGVRDGAGYVMALDDDLAARLADRRAWDDRRGSGYFAYANLNYALVAAVMEGASGVRFDQLMQKELFVPLRIAGCFNWSGCRAGATRRAVVLYRASGESAADDLRGRAPPCPGLPARDGSCDLARYRLTRTSGFFSPQGGLRLAPLGLARLGMAIVRPGYLSRATLAQLAQPVWRFDGANGETERGLFCAYGLGVMFTASAVRRAECRDDPVG